MTDTTTPETETPTAAPNPPPELPGVDSPLSALSGGPGLVYSRLIALKQAVSPLSKDNDFRAKNKAGLMQNLYKYRGIDDLYNHLHALMGEYGLLLVPSEVVKIDRAVFTTSGGSRSNHVALVQRYVWMAEDGSTLPVDLPGEGMDVGDKATGKALSMAHKYALVQSLNLPVGEPDGDAFATEGTPAVSYAGPGAEDSQQHAQAAPAPAAPRPSQRSPERPAWDSATGARERAPYPSEDAAADAVGGATPDTRQQVQRRIMDTVAAGVITGGVANTMLSQLKDHTKSRE